MEVCAVLCTADELDQTLKKLNAEGWYIRQVYQEALSHYRIFAKRDTTEKSPKGDEDGREAEALQVIKDNPRLSLMNIAVKLKALGIKRGKTWVGNKRYEILSG